MSSRISDSNPNFPTIDGQKSRLSPEVKTIKTTAAAIGINSASVRRTLKRWIGDTEKSKLFNNSQIRFIQSIKSDTAWPDWLDVIWCEHYVPRAKGARVVGFKRSNVDAAVTTLLNETAGMFDDSSVEALNDQLAAKLADTETEINLIRKKSDDLTSNLAEANLRIAELQKERDQGTELAAIEAYEADTWRKRIDDAVRYVLSDYLIPKVVLLAFQSYIYAMYVMRVFAFLNTQISNRSDIAEKYADTVLHEPWFYGMWVLGFFVDGAGFAIAQKLSEPKYLAFGDTRLTWIGWFFVLQVVIDMCYLFGTFHPIIEWSGAVVIVVAPALGIMAYSRATFKKGEA